nr:ATP-binding protein [Pseudalkalibacillus caeni]
MFKKLISALKRHPALSYMVISLVWVTLTDYYLELYFSENRTIDTLKGWFFVAVTTWLIYIILKKDKQEKVAKSEEIKLNTLINSMPDFVCFKDGNGRWIKVNEYGKQLYQLEGVDYVNKSDRELAEISPFFKDAFLHCVDSDEEAWVNRKLTRCEESFLIPSGEMKTFDVIKVPLFFSNGERNGLVTIGRDVTQLKQTEAILRNREKLSVAGELAAGIAHEIRNPLTSVRGFLQFMKEMDKPSPDHFDIMSIELDRINEIVSELLVLSKPQSKSFKFVEINTHLQKVINLLNHEALITKAKIDTHFEGKKLIIFGDEDSLKQAFINIIKNAIEAMPSGGEINVQTEIKNNEVSITIKDNGIGIPKERLARIGEPFYTLKEKGMGLGMTITNKIIEEHKGSLKIESEVNVGTTVTVSLPVSEEKEKAI